MNENPIPYDSTEDTQAHIENVGVFINKIRSELWKRARDHDASKLEEPEKSAFDKATPKLKDFEYGSPEYKEALNEIRPALDHHYANNSHHPEFWVNGVQDMDLVDLVEMVCDWKAAALRVKGDGSVNVRHNQERFNLDPQLARIIQNTIDRYLTNG